MLLQGIFAAMTTPFYPDGRVYYKKIEHNVDRYSRTPISGLAVMGSTGEAVMLSDEERREVLKVSRQFAADEKVIIAGVGCESAVETVRLAEYAASLQYDLALVRTPSYYRPQNTPEAQLAYYRFVADRSPLPLLLYSVPPFTGYDLPVETVIQLADHPNILGIKESSGDLAKIQHMVEGTRHVKHTVNVTEVFSAVTGRMLAPRNDHAGSEVAASAGAQASVLTEAPPVAAFKLRTKEVSFQVIAGAAQKLEPSLNAGATGAVLAFAAAAPTACYEVYAAWKEGDLDLAKEKQERIGAAAKRVAAEMGIPALKYAMDLNGYYGGNARLPFLPLTADQKREIEQWMVDIRN